MPAPIPGPLPFATATLSGIVSTGVQTFGGNKIFNGNVQVVGSLQAGSLSLPSVTNPSGTLTLTGSPTSTGTAVGTVVNAANALTTAGDLLLSVRNNNVQKFWVDRNGALFSAASQPLIGLLPDTTGQTGNVLTVTAPNTVGWVAASGSSLPPTAGHTNSLLATLTGGPAQWVTGSVLTTATANILDYGAVPYLSTPGHYPDNALAIRAALAASLTVDIPAGVFYTSEPVWLKNSNQVIRGQGRGTTFVAASSGIPTVTTGAPGFGGPVFVCGSGQTVSYGPTLYSNGTRSLRLDQGITTQIILDDLSGWNTYTRGSHALTIDGRFKLATALGSGALVSSTAYKVDANVTNDFICAYGVFVQNFGGGPFWQIRLTTTDQGIITLSGTPGEISTGVVYEFSLDYDGSNVYLYINGNVHLSAVATGGIVQEFYEGQNIGASANFAAYTELGRPADGYIEGVRMSTTCIHPGGTPYVPSGLKPGPVGLTWAIYNWDQGDPYDALAPWVQGQCFTGNPSQPSVIHYARLPGGFNGPHFLTDLSLSGSSPFGCTGLVWNGSFTSLIARVAMSGVGWGLLHYDGASFYSRHEDLYISHGAGIGYIASPYTSVNCTVVTGTIGAFIGAGSTYNLNIQPGGGSACTYPLIFGNFGFGFFSSILAVGASVDAEGSFPSLKAAMLLGGLQGLKTSFCGFATNGAPSTCPGVLISQFLNEGGWQSENDIFAQDDNSTGGRVAVVSGTPITGEIDFRGSRFGGVNVPVTPSPELPRIKFSLDDKVWTPNNSSAVATILDTSQALTVAGAKLASVRNHGVEKFFIDKDGFAFSAASGSAAILPPYAADIRQFGAIPSPEPGTFYPAPNTIATANSAAFKAAFASLTTDLGPINTPTGTVYVPPGRWWIAEPIWMSTNSRLTGAGRLQTTIQTANAGSGLGGIQEGFVGAAVITGTIANVQSFGADLFGGSGRSLTITPANSTCVYLHDSNWWSTLYTLSQFTIDGRIKINTITGATTETVVQSFCFPPDQFPANNSQIAFLFGVVTIAGQTKFRAQITTTGQGSIVIDSVAGLPINGGTYDFSLDWDGSNFRFYVSGTFIGSAVATGNIVQSPFTNVTIGSSCASPESNDPVLGPVLQCQLQSLRLSNIARHTTNANYTPPTAPFVEDANTKALYNWDQGDAPAGAPWILGQSHPGVFGGGGLIKHYCRLNVGGSENQIDNLQVAAGGVSSGIIFNGNPLALINNVLVSNCTKWGIFSASANGFFSRVVDTIVFGVSQIGACLYSYNSNNVTVTAGARVQFWLVSGTYNSMNAQPEADTIHSFVFGGAGFGLFSQVTIDGSGTDTEGTFPLLKSGALIGNDLVNLKTSGCNFQGTTLAGLPNMIVCSPTVIWTSINDLFLTNDTATGLIEKIASVTFTGSILIAQPIRPSLVVPWTTTLTGLITQPVTSILA